MEAADVTQCDLLDIKIHNEFNLYLGSLFLTLDILIITISKYQ